MREPRLPQRPEKNSGAMAEAAPLAQSTTSLRRSGQAGDGGEQELLVVGAKGVIHGGAANLAGSGAVTDSSWRKISSSMRSSVSSGNL